jgi:hypothetical protein
MKKIVWAAAAALPCLLVACTKQDRPEPERMTDASPTASFSIVPPFTADQKNKMRTSLEARVKKELEGKTFIQGAWSDAVNVDLPVDYIRCKKEGGGYEKPEDCHLGIAEGADPQPKRTMRIQQLGAAGSKHYWVFIRSERLPDEFMFCADMMEESTPSYMSGYCWFRPHENGGLHKVTMNVVTSDETHKDRSVFFDFEDLGAASSGGTDVHNGEGHGGDS